MESISRTLLISLLLFPCRASTENELSHDALFAPNTTYPYFENAPFPKRSQAQAFDIEMARHLAEASLLSYVKDAAFIEAALKKAGFPETRFFSNKGSFAFLAIRDDALVLCFRGTEASDHTDFFTNSQIVQDTFENNGTAHQGFITALEWIIDDIDAAVDSMISPRPRPLWVTGHSLGGALATLYGIHNEAVVSAIYTYGTPRVGGIEFAKNAEKRIRLYRIVNGNDIIPRVPTPPFYRHIGPTYFITSDGTLLKDPPLTRKWESARKGHAELIQSIYNEHWLNGDFTAIPSDSIVDHSPRLYAESLQETSITMEKESSQ